MKRVALMLFLVVSMQFLASCSYFREMKEPYTGMKFMKVGGGCYQMGDIFGNGDPDERPVHEVCVSSFYIGKYEVTQGEWEKITGSNPSSKKECGPLCPVEQVSWLDVQAFILKFNTQTGLKARLPTEAEWEYAARSGGKRERYSGGDDLGAVAWHDLNAKDKLHPVGQKESNGLGLYDMSGNVWEWVSDWYSPDYYAVSPKDNPLGPINGRNRVIRGGSWFYNPKEVRVTGRYDNEAKTKGSYLGFRLVVPVQ